jgi:hypothetical protein
MPKCRDLAVTIAIVDQDPNLTIERVGWGGVGLSKFAGERLLGFTINSEHLAQNPLLVQSSLLQVQYSHVVFYEFPLHCNTHGWLKVPAKNLGPVLPQQFQMDIIIIKKVAKLLMANRLSTCEYTSDS